MRKLLYAFVFASILVLAGSAGFASFDEPGGGGTVPEHQVWLPVVKLEGPCQIAEGIKDLTAVLRRIGLAYNALPPSRTV